MATLKLFDWEDLGKDYPILYEALDKKYGIYTYGISELVKLAKLRKGETVLDLGCGTGISSEIIYNKIGKLGKLVGLDISPVMLNYAKQKFRGKDNAEFLLLDVFDLEKVFRISKLVDSRFDAVFANFSYWYFSLKSDLFFKKVYDVLSIKGRLAFNVTPFLIPFVFRGKWYNNFANILDRYITEILLRRGYTIEDSEQDELPSSFQIDGIESSLRRLGFSRIDSKLVSLPCTVIDMLEFNYEGFWQFGLKPIIGPLCKVPAEERKEIYHELIVRARQKLDRIRERPKIFNVLAKNQE